MEYQSDQDCTCVTGIKDLLCSKSTIYTALWCKMQSTRDLLTLKIWTLCSNTDNRAQAEMFTHVAIQNPTQSLG